MKKVIGLLILIVMLSGCAQEPQEIPPRRTDAEIIALIQIELIKQKVPYTKAEIDEMIKDIDDRNDRQDDAILFLAEKVEDLFTAILE